MHALPAWLSCYCCAELVVPSIAVLRTVGPHRCNKLSAAVVVAQVHEQGELAIRIDENVDETLSNVDSAQAQLLKYLRSVSSNRWLIMKVFAVLMVFLVIFVVFVA